ncbi:ABC transporter substrate-binding protein [Actinomycetes bacterium KLBMP 9759]
MGLDLLERPVLRDELSRRGLFTAVGAAGLLGAVACAPSAPAGPSAATVRTVTHPLGTSDIPVAPKRVVSLDSNGALQVSLELGAPLIASETLDGSVSVPGYLPAPPPGFTSLGFNKLNLERLAELGPDLIIGNMQRVEENYPKISAIAPTVPYENAGRGVDWREAVRVVGDVLGARAEVDRRLDGYAQRAAAVAGARAAAVQEYAVALLRFTDSELRIVRGGIFGSSILGHVGVRRPPSTDLPGGNPNYVSIAEDTVGLVADADVILYFVGGGGSEVGTPRATFDRYTTGGLWQLLPAVRAGRVVELDPVAWWDGYSVSAGMACLDELDQALARF